MPPARERRSWSVTCALFQVRGDKSPVAKTSSASSSVGSSGPGGRHRAAPPAFEQELARLKAAGVEVHEMGVEYLMEGATGEHVRELQRFLTQTGQYRYKDGVTGFYGPVTANAVKKWQHKHGLPASGGWGYQSREMYLRVKSVERRKLLASPEAPTGARPEFGFESTTSGLAPPDSSKSTSVNVGVAQTPVQTRSSAPTAVGLLTSAFWFGVGTAAVVVAGRVVSWQLALREQAAREREEMEEDRKQVYERWDTAVKSSDVDDLGGGNEAVDAGYAASEAVDLLGSTRGRKASIQRTVEERLEEARSEAEALLDEANRAFDEGKGEGAKKKKK